MTKKFDRVLSEQELVDIFESMGFGGGHGTFLDIANEVQQAVLAKLHEQQEPVAWVHPTDPTRSITHHQKLGAIKDGGAIEKTTRVFSIPAYTLPIPSCQVNLDSSNCIPDSSKMDVPSDDNSLTIAYMSGYHDGKRSTTPDGWQLVPKEPTEEMHLAARDWSAKLYGKAIGLEASHGCYKAMLAAAPKIGENKHE